MLPPQGASLKGGLTTCMVGIALVGSLGGDGAIVTIVGKDEEGLLNGGKGLGGGKWWVARYKGCFRMKSPGNLSIKASPVQGNPQGQMKSSRSHKINQR